MSRDELEVRLKPVATRHLIQSSPAVVSFNDMPPNRKLIELFSIEAYLYYEHKRVCGPGVTALHGGSA